MRAIRTCCCGCGNKPCTLTEHYEDTSSIQCPVCAFGLSTFGELSPYDPNVLGADPYAFKYIDPNNFRTANAPRRGVWVEDEDGSLITINLESDHSGFAHVAGYRGGPGGYSAPLSSQTSPDGHTELSDWHVQNMLNVVPFSPNSGGEYFASNLRMDISPGSDSIERPQGCNAPITVSGKVSPINNVVGDWVPCNTIILSDPLIPPPHIIRDELSSMCHFCNYNSTNLHVGFCSDIDADPGSCSNSWENLFLTEGHCCWNGNLETAFPDDMDQYPPDEYLDVCINYCDSRPWYPHPSREDIQNIEWEGLEVDNIVPEWFFDDDSQSRETWFAPYYGNALGRGDTHIPFPIDSLNGAAGTNSAGYIQAGRWHYQLHSPFGILPWSPQVWSEWIEHWKSPLIPQGNCTMKCTPENISSHRMAFIGRIHNPWVNDTPDKKTTEYYHPSDWSNTVVHSNAAFHGNFPASNYQFDDPDPNGRIDSIESSPITAGGGSITIPPPPGDNYENWEWMREWVIGGGKLVVLWTSLKNQNKYKDFENPDNHHSEFLWGESLSWYNPSPYTELLGAEGCGRNRSTYHDCNGIDYEGSPVGSPSPIDGSPTYGLPSGNERKCAHWHTEGDCEYSEFYVRSDSNSDLAEDGTDWYKNPTQCESVLRKFAYFCAGDAGTTGAAFYTPDDTDASESIDPDYIIETSSSGVTGPLLRIGCQKTKSPIEVTDIDGNKTPFSFSWTDARVLIPNKSNGGRALVGGENGCLVVEKRNGAGSVIVIYDSTVTGMNASQIPDILFHNACSAEMIPQGDTNDPLYDPVECQLTPEQLKLHACNNDFWAYMCQDYLSENGYEPTDPEGPVFWDNKDHQQQPKDNPCLEGLKAACCLPDGTCQMMDPWTCRENYGRWKGSYYSLGPNHHNGWYGWGRDDEYYEQGWGDISSRCCATCDDVSCAPAQRGLCCMKRIYTPNEGIGEYQCLGEDMMSHECCRTFREIGPGERGTGSGEHNIDHLGDQRVFYPYDEYPDLSCSDCQGFHAPDARPCGVHSDCTNPSYACCENWTCINCDDANVCMTDDDCIDEPTPRCCYHFNGSDEWGECAFCDLPGADGVE